MKMNAEMNVNRNEIDMNMSFNDEEKKEMGLAENCNVSAYSLVTIAAGILLAIGTVVYSVIAM